VIVVIEVVGHGVVGNKQIGPAIVVVIGLYHAEAMIADVIVHSRFY